MYAIKLNEAVKDNWKLPLITDYIKKWAEQTPDNIAMIGANNGDIFTYREFDETMTLRNRTEINDASCIPASSCLRPQTNHKILDVALLRLRFCDWFEAKCTNPYTILNHLFLCDSLEHRKKCFGPKTGFDVIEQRNILIY